MTRKILRAALFLLPVIVLLPHMSAFPFKSGSIYSDLLISHYPNGLFLQRALLVWKTIPLWSPLILSGYPFGANPLSGLFYLPGWLALFFPLPLGFNLVVILHLLWGSAGTYWLLRSEGHTERAALFGALAFEALPKVYSHLGAGHLSLVYAVAWTPWLLLAEKRAIEQGGRWRTLPGVVLGITALADVRWAAYSGLFWLAYSLYRWIGFSKTSGGTSRVLDVLQRSLRNWLPAFLVNLLAAGLVAAPLLLPLAQYTQLSTRSQLTAQESTFLSMPPGQLLGLVYPNIGGQVEWMLYPGAVVLALSIYVLSRPPARRRAAFWLIAALATLIFAIGSNIPPLEWIARLPGMDLLRVPPRVLFVTGFCLAATAAVGLDDLLDRLWGAEPPQVDRAGIVLFAVAAFIVFFAAGVWLVTDQTLGRVQFTWGAVFFLIGAAAVFLARARRISPGGLVVMVAAASLIDMVGVNGLSLDFRPVEAVFSEERETAHYLREQGGQSAFRVYSPSYSLPQHIAAWYGLELADGIDPLQLAAYADYMKEASGVPSQGYSVTLPPYATGNPATDNQGYQPDARKLGLLNVKYVVAAFPLQEDGLVLLARFGQTRIYQNRLALPRAWVQAADAPPGTQILSEAQVMVEPDRMLIKAAGPGLLVLSELAYSGWEAAVNGQTAPVETVGGLLRGVRLNPGAQEVQFVFRPWPVYLGLVIATLTWAFLIYTWGMKGFIPRKRNDRRG